MSDHLTPLSLFPQDSPLTCIHADLGLCSDCQAEWDYDPDSYLEFGAHPEGQARWAAFLADVDAEAAAYRRLEAEQAAADTLSPVDDCEIPF